MNTNNETTPETITPLIEQLARWIGNGKPEFVPVEPDENAESGWCYLNCWRKDGTCDTPNAIYGFAIWEGDDTVTAEWHSVYRKPDGSLVDVTPKPEGEKTILFVRSKDNLIPDYMPINKVLAKNLKGQLLRNKYIDLEKRLKRMRPTTRKLTKYDGKAIEEQFNKIRDVRQTELMSAFKSPSV